MENGKGHTSDIWKTEKVVDPMYGLRNYSRNDVVLRVEANQNSELNIKKSIITSTLPEQYVVAPASRMTRRTYR